VWAIFFISVVLVDFLSQISQGRVVKWVCESFSLGVFGCMDPHHNNKIYQSLEIEFSDTNEKN
jgi:hypothetical protein